MGRDLAQVVQTANALATDLQNFAGEITSRIKHIEVKYSVGAGTLACVMRGAGTAASGAGNIFVQANMER